MTTTAGAAPSQSTSKPPVLGRLVRGTVWLALRTPLQAVFILWSSRLILEAIGKDQTMAVNIAKALAGGLQRFMPENLALTIGGDNGGVPGLAGLVPLAMRFLQTRENAIAMGLADKLVRSNQE